MSILGCETLSASALSEDVPKFNKWSSEVKLQPKPSVSDLPDKLNEIIGLSRTFPSWFRNDAASLPYSSLNPWLQPFTTEFRDESDTTHQIGDNETNGSLEQALPAILRSCWRLEKYRSVSQVLGVGEADFRSVFDLILLDAIWPSQAEYSGLFHVAMEPLLNLPKAGDSGVRCTTVTPDTAFCIDAGPKLLNAFPTVLSDFSSFHHHRILESVFLPHLLIEYESSKTAGLSALRQLQIAMVSALYQRRALQHPEHFVFGICHVRPSTVAVLAATWVQKAIEPPTGNQNLQGARVTDDHAHAPTANVALESRQSDKDLEIKSYYLLQLNFAQPIDLVRLYLVVLAIIPLAKGYQRQLISNPPAMPAPGFKEWAEDETQTSKSRTSDTRASGSKRARVESESPGGDLTGATSPSHTLSLGGSSPEDGVPERKFGDIQRLPEMSSYYKCLHYVQSLPS